MAKNEHSGIQQLTHLSNIIHGIFREYSREMPSTQIGKESSGSQPKPAQVKITTSHKSCLTAKQKARFTSSNGNAKQAM